MELFEEWRNDEESEGSLDEVGGKREEESGDKKDIVLFVGELVKL